MSRIVGVLISISAPAVNFFYDSFIGMLYREFLLRKSNRCIQLCSFKIFEQYVCSTSALLCYRNGHFCDFAEMSAAFNENADSLRQSTSHPDFSAVSCDDDIPSSVRIYRSDESYISLLINRVSSLCLKNNFIPSDTEPIIVCASPLVMHMSLRR